MRRAGLGRGDATRRSSGCSLLHAPARPSRARFLRPFHCHQPRGAQASRRQLHFNPENIVLKPGDSTTVGLAISGVHDLFSLPLLVKYNPAVIQIQDVQDGGFLSGGTEAVAIVQSINAQKGEVMISCTRRHGGAGAPNSAAESTAGAQTTTGVNGSGTILGLVVRGVSCGRIENSDRRSAGAGFAAAGDSSGHERSDGKSAVKGKRARRQMRRRAPNPQNRAADALYCAALAFAIPCSAGGCACDDVFQNSGSAFINSGSA